MTEKITMPRTIGGVTKKLAGLEGLVTSCQWERAAIVWAFTYDGRAKPQSAEVHSVAQFVALKIVGLKSNNTVNAYRNAWKRAMDEVGAPDVKPGQTIELPDLEWQFPPDGNHELRYTQQKPQSFATALATGKVNPVDLVEALDDTTAETVLQTLADRKPYDVVRHGQKASMRIFRDTSDDDADTRRIRRIPDQLDAFEKRPYQKAMRQVSAMAEASRALRDLKAELDEEQRGEIAQLMDHYANVLQLLATAYRSNDLDADLAALLASEEGG